VCRTEGVKSTGNVLECDEEREKETLKGKSGRPT
jgi:hypothetical protein